MQKETKFKERRSKGKMKNNLEEVNFLENNTIRERGITLIALVVTIIVLLILASISISVILGDNGLIEMAKEAGRKTNEAVEKEQGDIANLTNDLKDFIDGEKTLVQMFRDGELQVGDYINYESPDEGSYTAKADKTGMTRVNEDVKGLGITDQTFSVENNDLHWRILGIDEATGGLKLISGRPIKSDRVETANDPYFYMYGANACEYGMTELDNIAGIFKNEYAQEIRSVTIDDINEAVGITEDKIKDVNFFGGMQYGEKYTLTEQYTPESWLNGRKKTTVEGKVDGYGYSLDVDGGEGIVKVEDKTLLDMLFGNTEYPRDEHNVQYSDGACYWLASKRVRVIPNQYAVFGLGLVYTDVYEGYDEEYGEFRFESQSVKAIEDMFFSTGNLSYCKGFAVRPVVILKSDLTAKDLQKIDSIEEETWKYGKPEAEPEPTPTPTGSPGLPPEA